MVHAEALFGGEEISGRVVERAFNHAFCGATIAHTSGKCPSVGEQPRGKGVHAAKIVVAIGAGEREFVAHGKLRSAGVQALASTHTHESETVVVVGVHPFFVARGIIQPTQRRVVETSQFQVVEAQSVHVGLVVHVVQRTHAEAHRAKSKSDAVEEGIVFRLHRCHGLRSVEVLIELRLREGKVGVVVLKF